MNLLKPPGLLVLDVQIGFDDPYWGKRNNPQAEKNIAMLLSEWRKRNWPVLYSQHLSLLPQSPLNYKNKIGTEFKEAIRPQAGEKVFQKNVNSAFIGTQLEIYLHTEKIDTVVVTGLSTQHCVSTTTRMSGNLGFTTYLIEDAIAAFEITDHRGVTYTAEEIQKIELACLNKEFATVITTNELIAQLSGFQS